MRTYAVGDVHGHPDKLRAAHRLIAADRARTGDDSAPVVHLGDLVDRGPDSREVVEYLRRGAATGEPWVTLKGNHDFLFALFLRDPLARDPGMRADLTWLDRRIGGTTTLASYGVADAGDRPLAEVHAEAVAKVPRAHLEFIDALPLILRRGPVALVHAGVRPGVALDEQVASDLMWIRGPFHDFAGDYGALVIHGHTPVDQVTHFGNRVAVDTGAAYGGPVTAVVIEDRVVAVLTEDGRAVPAG